jgi:hypothetical protein
MLLAPGSSDLGSEGIDGIQLRRLARGIDPEE